MADSTLDKAFFDSVAVQQERISSARDRENRAAYDKQFDLYKHLTTLGASTIVVLVAFSDKPLNNNAAVFLRFSLLAMVGTVISGCVGMVLTVKVHRAYRSLFDQLYAAWSRIEGLQPIMEQCDEVVRMANAVASSEDKEKALKRANELVAEKQKWDERYEKAKAETHKALVEAGWAQFCERAVAVFGSSVFVIGMLMLVLFMGNR